MRFDNAALAEEVLWDCRIAEQPRAEDRRIVLRTFNGNPPYDEATADDNNIQINRSSLEGPNILNQACRQWDGAFLKPTNFFICKPDFGPAHKRMEWGNLATRHANRLLKRSRQMTGQIRAEGKQTLLYGVGPSMWKDRRSIVPASIPVGSLLIPSETEIDDWDNLQYFFAFREWTATQLYEMTHGPRRDPGWNMELVGAQMDYIRDELRKSPNSLAYQYMPERIEELIKQDKGYYGSDAVPTVDVWDMYFREAEDGAGWYRRILLDWGVGPTSGATMPRSRNKVGEKTEFLYTSGKRKYANSLDEVLFCQFGDCSAYAPHKYHSVRGLGWMLWGVVDLQDRLHCKFTETVFEQMLWFFQTAGNQDLIRLKKANFEHMGIIPQGVKFLTPQERYTPNQQLIQMAFARNQQLMANSSTSYTQDYEKTSNEGARTATETMAIVNSTNSLAGGIFERAYTYATYKYREMFRRLCLKNSTDPMAKEFRLSCLRDGIPEDMLDVEKWSIDPEQTVGGGNKTVQMATVGFLNQIRQNLPPNGQRLVDHISVEAATDQPDLAEEMVPLGEEKPISNSMHDAQLATERLLRGFEFQLPKEGVPEDYVTVWMHDMGVLLQKTMAAGGMTDPETLNGLMNIGNHIGMLLQQMAANPNDKAKVKEYEDLFGQMMNHVKALAQRLEQSMAEQQQGNGAQGPDPKAAAQAQSMVMLAQTKAKIAEQNAQMKQRQKQEQFDAGERRKDVQIAADVQREGVKTKHELLANRLKAVAESASEPVSTE